MAQDALPPLQPPPLPLRRQAGPQHPHVQVAADKGGCQGQRVQVRQVRVLGQPRPVLRVVFALDAAVAESRGPGPGGLGRGPAGARVVAHGRDVEVEAAADGPRRPLPPAAFVAHVRDVAEGAAELEEVVAGPERREAFQRVGQ